MSRTADLRVIVDDFKARALRLAMLGSLAKEFGIFTVGAQTGIKGLRCKLGFSARKKMTDYLSTLNTLFPALLVCKQGH